MTKNEPRSVFLDASVLFSACFSNTGSAHDLVVGSPTSRWRLVATERVILEARNNLFRHRESSLATLERFITSHIRMVGNPTEATVESVSQLIVAKDVPIVAGAIDCQSTIIATYDRKHLISMSTAMEQLWGIRALTPIEILSMQIE